MTSKVLLVEDDDFLRSVIGTHLRDMGHEVREARDGREALEVIRHEPADLVITDLTMPGMGGIETIGQLRSIYPALRIIAMSGDARTDDGGSLAEAKSLGVDGTLSKPFSRAELALALAKLYAARAALEDAKREPPDSTGGSA